MIMSFKETKVYKWFDNFWYHYKWIAIVVSIFAVFIIVSSVQMATKEDGDIYVMYAGSAVINVQNATYIERAFESIDDNDFSGDGKVNAVLRDLTIMSADEIKAATEDEMEEMGVPNEGYNINEQMVNAHMSDSMQTFNQEILGGDSVICLLSPYMYSIVREADGFLPLEDALGYTPEKAYDECALYLADTDFGKLEGLSTLPKDTLFCIRRISSMSFLKGQSKTEKSYEYHLEKFRGAVNYVKAVEITEK